MSYSNVGAALSPCPAKTRAANTCGKGDVSNPKRHVVRRSRFLLRGCTLWYIRYAQEGNNNRRLHVLLLIYGLVSARLLRREVRLGGSAGQWDVDQQQW